MLLARALATQAPVLLADEPIAALDVWHQLIALEVLKAHAGAGATVVPILHDLTLAARFADRIVLPDQAKIEAAGPAQAVLTEAGLASSLGVRAWVATEGSRPLVLAQSPCRRRNRAAAGASERRQGYIDKDVSPSDTAWLKTAGP